MREVLKRNNVLVFGKGTEPIMFAHGFGCDQNIWRLITPAFEEEYKIILFDLVGFGKSDFKEYNKERYNDLNGYAQDILEIIEALELKDILFVGHSVAAMIGLIAAVKERDAFKSMIFINITPCYENKISYRGGFDRESLVEILNLMKMNYIGWVKYFAPIIMKNPDKPGLSEDLIKTLSVSNPEITIKFAEIVFLSDNTDYLKKLKIPSLILQTYDDIFVPPEVSEFVAQEIKNSTLKFMDATGHFPQLSAPAETIKPIKIFLENTKSNI